MGVIADILENRLARECACEAGVDYVGAIAVGTWGRGARGVARDFAGHRPADAGMDRADGRAVHRIMVPARRAQGGIQRSDRAS